MIKYPLPKDMVKSHTGKKLDSINMKSVLDGSVTSEDIKISRETLKLQGEIANEAGKKQLQQNFDRASELTDVEDELILEIYDKLRPNRATKNELLDYADTLEKKYRAVMCADFIRDAVKVYERRGILRKI
ncbi:propanediol dehydratase small subunit [Vallitalea longa]|uniref:Propanediol dehydratase small subunit n=1 Tax=Vallitalea longa TaxID=2936439 RepID=A0A9W6DE95_9FIRM|nr:diol dehydratase small subunit [Vallitalea longa]GKX28172.1 propanediol dehydratase small subunit [Vallitalea longa]